MPEGDDTGGPGKQDQEPRLAQQTVSDHRDAQSRSPFHATARQPDETCQASEMGREIPPPRVLHPSEGSNAPGSRRHDQEHDGGPNGHDIEADPQDRRIPPARAIRLRASPCRIGRSEPDFEHQQRKQSQPADIDQTGPRSNGSIIGGDTMQSTSSPPRRCQSSPRLETRPTPARHMTDGRRTGDQDFDFFFPRRRSASNSRPPPASTKALIPAPTAISGAPGLWPVSPGLAGSVPLGSARSAYALAANPTSRKASSPILRVTARKPDIGVSTWCLLSIVVPFA